MARRLFDDLEVDDSDFRQDFAWKPTLGLEDGLRLMAADYARRMRIAHRCGSILTIVHTGLT
jgi:hypothetical protein